MTFPAFLDTCVLFGATLNDTVLRIAEEGVFRPLWSVDVLTELHSNLATLVGERAAHRRVSAMKDAFPTAMVEGYEPLIESMTCDPKDRHVLAAAVQSDSQVLVTFNVGDFPASSVAGFDMAVVEPDDFLLDQLDLHPGKVGRALLRQMSEATRPALTMGELLGTLARSGVPRFSSEVRRHEFTAQLIEDAE